MTIVTILSNNHCEMYLNYFYLYIPTQHLENYIVGILKIFYAQYCANILL